MKDVSFWRYMFTEIERNTYGKRLNKKAIMNWIDEYTKVDEEEMWKKERLRPLFMRWKKSES